MADDKTPEQYADEGVILMCDETATAGQTPQERQESLEWFRRYLARREENSQPRRLPPEAIAVISTQRHS